MRRINLILLALLIGAAFPLSALAGNITGDTVNWQYYAYGGAYTYAYGGGTTSGSFAVPCTSCGNFDGYFLIDSGPNSITFDYSEYTGSPVNWAASALSLSPDIYNGIDLLFTGGSITSVSIDAATNMAGFNLSDVYFTGNEIQVNWANLPFDSSTIVTLDVNGTAATPEPGSLALLGSGLLASIGFMRRKLGR
jgi:hypothetical protein